MRLPVSNARKGTKLEIDPKKFDYLYGKVNSGEHNTARSTQLSQMMRRLGLQTNESGTAILTEYFNKVVNTKGNVINNYKKGSQSFEVRESFLMGPSGKGTVLQTSFEIMPDGSRRFVTTIPKEGKKQMFIQSFPDEIDLLAFFEGEPIFQNTEDLHFAYKYTDQNEMSILFSFSATGGWIQTIIEFKQKKIAHNLMEGVEYFKIEKDVDGEYLTTEVVLEDTRTKVEIRLQPFISTEFSTLIR